MRVSKEDIPYTTFSSKLGCFANKIIPFGLKNVPIVFSRIVVATYKEFMNNFLEVYLDDWTMFSLLKKHIQVLRLMLDRCRDM